MTELILGLLLFSVPHLWKRLSPGSRARLGDPGKGLVAVLLVAGIWLMARGYGGWTNDPQVWTPAPWLVHLNNLMVLVAVWLFVASGMGVWIARVNRHPQLSAVIVWAVAHLLVNGDLASIVLFGGLLAWALVSIALINRAQTDWTPPARPARAAAREVVAVVVALVAYAVIGYVHGWIGPWPFGT